MPARAAVAARDRGCSGSVADGGGGISPAICPVADLVRKADMQPALPCLALALA